LFIPVVINKITCKISHDFAVLSWPQTILVGHKRVLMFREFSALPIFLLEISPVKYLPVSRFWKMTDIREIFLLLVMK